MSSGPGLASCALLLAALASPAVEPATPRADRAAAGDWRSARWGMTVDDVLKAFPGEAKRLDPPITLKDGNVVAAGIDGYFVASHEFQVRFVFERGKLALVSLRTPQTQFADPDVFKQIEKVLASELGAPLSSDADASFIDMRQIRWNVGRSQVDLEFIPGVVVILYHPRTPPG